MVRVASLQTGNKKEGVSERLFGSQKVNMGFICLRLVEDSDGLRPSRRGVQGVAAGVPRRELVITQEDDAGAGFRLKGRREDADLSQQISQRYSQQCILPPRSCLRGCGLTFTRSQNVHIYTAFSRSSHLGVTRVSSSVGWRILQVVKV